MRLSVLGHYARSYLKKEEEPDKGVRHFGTDHVREIGGRLAFYAHLLKLVLGSLNLHSHILLWSIGLEGWVSSGFDLELQTSDGVDGKTDTTQHVPFMASAFLAYQLQKPNGKYTS